MTAAAPIDIIPRPPEDALPWEKLSVALVDILGGMQQIVTVDELKCADAALGDSYRGLSSFERLAQTAVNVLIAKGLVDEGDLQVRMARLALAGEEEHRLAVLVLEAVDRLGVEPGDVVRHLTGRVGIELKADAVHFGMDTVRLGVVPNEAGEHRVIFVAQHAGLRKGELVHGVLGDAVPVDQLFHDVGIGPEGQDERHDLDGLLQ